MIAAMVKEVISAGFLVVWWNSDGFSANSAHKEDGVFVLRAELVWKCRRDKIVLDKMPSCLTVWVFTDAKSELFIFLLFAIILELFLYTSVAKMLFKPMRRQVSSDIFMFSDGGGHGSVTRVDSSRLKINCANTSIGDSIWKKNE